MAAVNSIFALFIVWGIVWAILGKWIWQLWRAWRNRGKMWSVEMNGNTALAPVRLVRPTKENFKAKNGELIKPELNFLFRDPITNRAVLVWDGDTGLPMRPYSGEVEVADSSHYSVASAGAHLNNIRRGRGDIIKMLLVIVVGGIAALLIVGFLILKAVGGVGGIAG